MLESICMVVLMEKRNIVKQNECCEVYRQPSRVIILLGHLLQLVQHLSSPFRLKLANQDQFDLRSHHRRQRNFPFDWACLIHDVGVHAEALVSNDQC